MNYQNSEISLFALISCLFLTLSTEVSYNENLPVYLECGGKLQNKFSGPIPEYILPSVTEVKRERELSEKMLKTTILSEAALQYLQDKGSSSSSSSQLCKLRGKAQWSVPNIFCSCEKDAWIWGRRFLYFSLWVKNVLIILQVREGNQVKGGLVIL